MSKYVEGQRVRISPGNPRAPRSLCGCSGTVTVVSPVMQIPDNGTAPDQTEPIYTVQFDGDMPERDVRESWLEPVM